MTVNVMDEYLDIVKKYIPKYMKTILGYKYNAEICDKLTGKYIQARYYNYFRFCFNCLCFNAVYKQVAIKKIIIQGEKLWKSIIMKQQV